MAFISNGDLILQAVLTKRGREILYNNNERFLVSKFALADDEINYNLINQQDSDYTNVQNLSVVEASTNSFNALKSKLIRKTKDELQQLAKQSQFKFVPSDEMQLQVQLSNNSAFSLENWKTEEKEITFSIYDPRIQAYSLSNSFVIDISQFFIKYGISFNVTPTSPTGIIGASTLNYWYNTTDSFKDINNNILQVIIGIDNDHKPVDGTALQDFTNQLQIPALSFKLSLKEQEIKNIFSFMLANNISSINDEILIYNNDSNVVPITDFFAPQNTNSFRNISMKIPITITF
jgi:hypothetical protein